jgi:antitoxin component YwqK of YwqJK toxin-antitoxin module
MQNSLIYLIFILLLFSCGEDSTLDDDHDDDDYPNEFFDEEGLSPGSNENTFESLGKERLSDSNKNTQHDIIQGNLKDTVDFKCQEWYPGKKQLKIEGGLDRQNRRHGTWYYYNEEGGEMSMTTYTNGRKQGFSIVKHPNGAIYYTGEYDTDKKVGQWKFYDEKGKKVNEVNYDN